MCPLVKFGVTGLATPTEAHSATVYPSFSFPCLLLVFLPPSNLNSFKQTWHIHLCAWALSNVKSRRWMCPLVKSTALLFTALGLSLLLLSRTDLSPSLSLLAHLSTLPLLFSFSFLQLWNVKPCNRFKCQQNVFKRDTNKHAACYFACIYKMTAAYP